MADAVRRLAFVCVLLTMASTYGCEIHRIELWCVRWWICMYPVPSIEVSMVLVGEYVGRDSQRLHHPGTT
jgi:hypothetical protein